MFKINNLLLVRDPWVTLILSGYKTWEIRGTRLGEDKIKTIAIAKSGEKGIHRIYGLVDIKECIGPLTLTDLQRNFDKHRDQEDIKKLPYEKTYAWVLENPRLLKTPLDYEYKNGWVIWGVGDWVFDDEDFIDPKSFTSMTSPTIQSKKRFIESLSSDMKCFDIELNEANLGYTDVYTIKLPELSNISEREHRKYLNNSFKKLQGKNRVFEGEHLAIIKKMLLNKNLIADKAIRIEELNLSFKLVKTSEEKDIHWYFRMQQNIPSSKSIGRVMDGILYHTDLESNAKHIVGIVGLGSPAYTSGGRDELFGWPASNHTDLELKNKGLKSLIQINCIFAVPPYDREPYRLTKLLAMSAFSSEVVNSYQNKFNSPMLSVISSAGFGLNSPLFHRISLISLVEKCKIEDYLDPNSRNQSEAHELWCNPTYLKDGRKNSRHWIFHREAISTSTLFSLASNQTRVLAKEYCESAGSIEKMSSPNEAFKKALQFCGIHKNILPTVSRGIYIGFLCNSYIKNLVTGNIEEVHAKSIKWDDLVYWWKSTEIARLKKNGSSL